jgi:RNA polymerase sigma-70 factor, ECF subfamily
LASLLLSSATAALALTRSLSSTHQTYPGRNATAIASNGQVDGAGGELSPEILDACRRGDREAFRALYEAYKDRVYSIAFYFFQADADAAGEVTQQVFLKLMREIARFRGDAAFSTWLYRLVVNACVDRARGRRSDVVGEDPATLDSIAASPTLSHEEMFARREVATSVQQAVATLPPKLRAAILLRYFEELSYSDMAHALNCSIGTVASRLSRGHRLLAKKLAPVRLALRPLDSARGRG